jgi:hypothetical protein
MRCIDRAPFPLFPLPPYLADTTSDNIRGRAGAGATSAFCGETTATRYLKAIDYASPKRTVPTW